MSGNQHVIKHGERWAVKAEGSSRVTAVYDTRREAIYAAERAIKGHSNELYVHNANGAIEHKGEYSDAPLTESKLVEDPLRLLNVSVDERERFFEARIKAPFVKLETVEEEVQKAETLSNTFARVFQALASDPVELRELADAGLALGEAWRTYKPSMLHIVWFSHWQNDEEEPLMPMEDCLPDNPSSTHRLRISELPYSPEMSPKVNVWTVLDVQDAEGWDLNIWQELMELLESVEKTGDVGCCQYCRDIFMRGRSDQKYCSKSCRVMASRKRSRVDG